MPEGGEKAHLYGKESVLRHPDRTEGWASWPFGRGPRQNGSGRATVSGNPLSQGARMETESSLPPTRPPALDGQQLLVDRARRGDPAAQRALYDAHVERV